MSHHSLTRWLPRVVVCTLAATTAFPLTDTSYGRRSFALELEMSSASDGVLQVFFDRGGGIREADSVTTPIRSSAGPTRYRVPLEAASYRLFRIDPNDKAGRYTISALRFTTDAGQTVVDVPLNVLQAAAQASITLTPDGLRVEVPPGSNDPQLVFAPVTPIELVERGSQQRRAAIAAAIALTALALFFVIERITQRHDLSRLRVVINARPHRAIVATAIVATAVSTYPLLLGRSLVSPNNGGAAMIYDQPPYVYGSHDFALEDARGTDYGAMMWLVLPYAAADREALGNREFPLWNRYNALGRPLWGQGQTFFLEPVHLLALAVAEPSYFGDITFVAGRFIFAAGTGFAALAAVASPAASIVVTAAAPFVGYFGFRLNHPAYFSIVYAPWILWGYFLLASSSRSNQHCRAGLAITASSVLQLLGSTPKEGVITFAVAHFAGFLAIAFTPAAGRLFAARLGYAAVAATATLLLAAPYWLIFLDTLRRGVTLYDVPTVAFGGWHELAAIAAGTWLPGMPRPSLNGLLVVLAGVAALSPLVIRTYPAVLGSIVAAVIAISIACGAVPASTMTALPFIGNLYHVWNVFITASLPALMVVAAAGVVAIERTPLRSLLLCVVVIITFSVIMFAGWVYESRALLLVIALSLAPALGFGVLIATARNLPQVSVTVAAVAVLLVACLPGGLHFETGIDLLDRTLLQPRLRADLDEPSPAIRAVQQQKSDEPFRIASLGTNVFPGIQVYFGLEGITGPDALELPEFRELTDAAGILRTNWGWLSLFSSLDLVQARGYLDMIGVRFVFGTRAELPSALPRLPLDAADELEVVERESAWPRAFFVDGSRRHSSVFDVVKEAAAVTGPFVSIASDDAAAVAAVAHLPLRETRHVAARAYQLTSNRTAFVVDAPGPGIVALGEAYVPLDFRATLNGRSIEYMRVNHVFKGIVIPNAGTWHVAFEYRPARWTQAWTMSGIGAILCVALVLFARSRRDEYPGAERSSRIPTEQRQ